MNSNFQEISRKLALKSFFKQSDFSIFSVIFVKSSDTASFGLICLNEQIKRTIEKIGKLKVSMSCLNDDLISQHVLS